MQDEAKIRELEQQLEESQKIVEELSSLLQAVEVVNSSLQLDTLLDSLMDLATQITESEAASALLIEDDRLCFTAASGTRSTEIKKIYLAKDEGVAGWVVAHREPLLIPDVTRDPRFSAKADHDSGFVTRSILAVPLQTEDRIIGVIEAVNKKEGRSFDENDCRLLASLSSSAAIAIHKAQMFHDLNELFIATIRSLANAIEAKDLYTRGHSERIRDFSLVIAQEMALPEDRMKHIEIAALLHDVGKIGVPEAVLRKQGKLTDEEFAEIKKHPALGAEILSSIKQLKESLPGIRYHQERFDGKGYPSGLKGMDIPLFARMIAVADTFDAMTSDRPYRSALPDGVALEELRRMSGIQFDPECVVAFFRGYEKGLIRSSRARTEKDAGIVPGDRTADGGFLQQQGE
jgi:HD-GYP domain-containing protein (c-di-GMP phosphodiesterase class II)